MPTTPTVATVELIELDPKLAATFLEGQAPNRNPKNMKIKQFARDMAAGRWEFTGEAIKFDNTGRMIDGQNRCLAVVESGATIRVLLVRGLPTEAQGVMDSGTPRSARDALTFAGYENVKDLAATVSAHRAWKAGAFMHCMASLGYHSRPTNSEVVEYVTANPELPEAASRAHGIYCRGLRLPVGAIATALVETAKISPDDSAEFFDRIVALRTSGVGDPIHALLKRVEQVRVQSRRMELSMALFLLFRAWNAWRDGESLTKFQLGAPAKDGKPATWAKIPEPK